ncbi:hypothetical protein TNCV_1647281 [Trichonephila clavipes]|nr:hypothetical protein TNCV_1647281 [Trichonephila clavipes]
MSSHVANRLPRIDSIILDMRSKSQGEMLEEYVILLCPQDPDVYPECHVIPVEPESPCSTVLFGCKRTVQHELVPSPTD